MYPDESDVDRDMEIAGTYGKKLSEMQGSVMASADSLLQALETYAEGMRYAENAFVYAHMKHDEDNADSKYTEMYGRAVSAITRFSADASFLEPEILSSDAETIDGYFSENSGLEKYRFMIDQIMHGKDHVLSPDQEYVLASLHEVLKSSGSIYSALCDADLVFGTVTDSDGKVRDLTHSTYIGFMESNDRRVRKEAFDKIKNAKGDTKAIGEGLSGIGSAVSSFTPALQQFSSDISTIFGFDDSKIQGIIGAVDGLGNTAVGIGQALSGDIVGGSMKAVSGIASVVSSLEGVFGADYSGYERLKEQYELLNGVWDTLIDKKKEYISMSYGEEATKAGEEAKKLINDQISRYRQLLDELAGSGASIGSHSLAYRINDRMAKEDWAIISKLVGETIKESNDLWDLTADQLEKLLQDPKIVSVLGEVNEDFLTYIQDIIDAQDELEEVEKSIQEQLTQTSFENMQDSFWNTLLDMEKDAEAFGDDLTKTMQKAIIKANLGKIYESQLQDWYEKFAKANQSDGINTEEYESLRNEYDAIVEAALKERNELMKVFGWESEAAASAAQSGRAGAVTTITEETAGRLEGIGNAQLDRIIAMDDKMENMGDSLSAMASNIAIMTENSNYLRRLEDIADNIQIMNSTGVKIKG
jgi:hypothetical protein